jgi:hypothetical protein
MAQPLNPDQLISEANTMQGALGAIAYGVLKGLQAGGADAQLIASFRVLMHEHFQRIPDADVNTLCDVVFRRLSEEAKKGKWY